MSGVAHILAGLLHRTDTRKRETKGGVREVALMDRLAKLDSSLQRGLDNSMAAVFGGKVVPEEIEELVKQEAQDSLVVTERDEYVAPNVYAVGVSSKLSLIHI